MRLCRRAGSGLCAVYGSSGVISGRGCTDQWETLNVAVWAFGLLFRLSALKKQRKRPYVENR